MGLFIGGRSAYTDPDEDWGERRVVSERWNATDAGGAESIVTIKLSDPWVHSFYTHDRTDPNGEPMETLTVGGLPLEAARQLCEERYGSERWERIVSEVKPRTKAEREADHKGAEALGSAMAKCFIDAMEEE